MVTDAIVAFVVGLLRFLLSLVPDWSPPAGGPAWGAVAGGVVGMLSGYFPLVALGSSIVAVYAFRAVVSIWAVLVFIYDRFPAKFT